MNYYPPMDRPAIHENRKVDPLEDALERKSKVDKVYRKYNLNRPKDRQMPSIQWEGEDRG